MAADYEVQKTSGIPPARIGYQLISFSGTYMKGCRTVQALGFETSLENAKSLRDDIYTPKYELMLQEEGADWYQFLLFLVNPNIGLSSLIEVSPMKRRQLEATVLQPVKKKAPAKKTLINESSFGVILDLVNDTFVAVDAPNLDNHF